MRAGGVPGAEGVGVPRGWPRWPSFRFIASRSASAPAPAAAFPAGPSARSARRRSLSPASLMNDLRDQVGDGQQVRLDGGGEAVDDLGRPVPAFGVQDVPEGGYCSSSGLLSGDPVSSELVSELEEFEPTRRKSRLCQWPSVALTSPSYAEAGTSASFAASPSGTARSSDQPVTTWATSSSRIRSSLTYQCSVLPCSGSSAWTFILVPWVMSSTSTSSAQRPFPRSTRMGACLLD